MLPHQCAHFPAAGEEIRRTRYIDFQHQELSEANSAQISSRNLTACHNPNKRAAGDLVQMYWQKWNKTVSRSQRR
jgi:hypothetical protein